MTTPTLRVEVVPRPVWQPRLEAALGQLPEPQRPRLEAILESLHDRHVGISIRLAAELAGLLAPGARAPRQKGWGDVFARLQRELRHAGRAAGELGLLLHADPAYTLFRLAQPVIQEASRRLGMNVLLCEDDRGGLTADDYDAYTARLQQAVSEVARGDGDRSLDLFWTERAATLATRSGRLAAGDLRLPESTPLDRACFYRLTADSIRPPEPVARFRPRDAAAEHRGAAREEGYDGIRIARGIENLSDMLHSEYMNHPTLLADRIVHSGYFAHKRFARRESLRHALVTGALPPSLAGRAGGSFAKACWFDFAGRAAFLLARSRLLRSEVRWSEGEADGRLHSLRRSLEDLPPAAGHATHPETFRRGFVHGLQWLPDFLDHRGGLPLELPAEPDAIQNLANWLRLAWNGADGGDRRVLSSYGMVRVMVFAPAALRAQPGGAQLGKTLHAALGFGSSPGRRLTLTWVPERIDDLEAWDIEESAGRRHHTPRPSPRGDAARTVAGWLQENWMHAFRQEMSGG